MPQAHEGEQVMCNENGSGDGRGRMKSGVATMSGTRNMA